MTQISVIFLWKNKKSKKKFKKSIKDKEIIEEVRKIKKYSDIEMMDKEKAMQKKYYQVIGEALEKRF